MTTDPERQAQIDAIAEAKCLNCHGSGKDGDGETFSHPCEDCNGTGLHPLSELLRVECERPAAHFSPKWSGAVDHVAICPGWVAATSDEAKERFHDMLVAFYADAVHVIKCPEVGSTGHLADEFSHTFEWWNTVEPLDALLAAMMQVMDVEVKV